MEKNILYLLSVLVCFSFVGVETKQYEGSTKFTINYPSSWTLDESGQFGTELLILAQQENESDDFKENCSVIIQDVSAYGDFTLKQYVTASEQMLGGVITDYKLITKVESKLAGLDAYTLIYKGKQGVYDLQFAQTLALVDGITHIVTCSGKEVDFEKYKKRFQMMTSSYKIKK